MNDEMINFNIECFLDAAGELARADEFTKALDLLDFMMPQYYVDNPPKEVIAMKRELLSKFATTSYLIESSAGCEIHRDNFGWLTETLRGTIILNEIKKINEKGFKPHITDYGPGDFSLYFMLRASNCEFTYKPICINQEALSKFKAITNNPDDDKYLGIGSGPAVFVATEIIEHLAMERELLAEVVRNCPNMPEIIHISTPKYSFDNHLKHWKFMGDIGHLRTYSIQTFFKTVEKMFPDYKIEMFDSKILHARLVKKNG